MPVAYPVYLPEVAWAIIDRRAGGRLSVDEVVRRLCADAPRMRGEIAARLVELPEPVTAASWELLALLLEWAEMHADELDAERESWLCRSCGDDGSEVAF